MRGELMAGSGLSGTSWCDRIPLFHFTSALLLLFLVSPAVGFLLGVNPPLPLLENFQSVIQQNAFSGILVLFLLAIPACVFFTRGMKLPAVVRALSLISRKTGHRLSPIIGWIRRCNGWLQALPFGKYLFGLVLLTFLLRFTWILLVPTVPRSDFMVYHTVAIQVSSLFSTDPGQIYFGMRALTFELVLGALYRLAGADPIVAKISNVFLSIAFVLLMFGLARYSLDEQTARIAALLSALLPSQIMMTSIVASEHLFTVLILLSLFMIVKGVVQDPAGYTWLLGAGLILGIAYTVRFIAVAVFLAVLVYLICANDRAIKASVIRVIPFVAGFLIVFSTLSMLILVTHTPPLPTQGFEYSFLTGTNVTGSGAYNPEVVAQFNSWSPQSARHQALMAGVRQITDSPVQFCVLLLKKVDIMWGGDYIAVYWAGFNDTPSGLQPVLPMTALVVLALISQGYYMGLLLLGAVGAYWLSRSAPRKDLYVYPLILITIFMVHSLLEVQQRYHFPFEFVIIILSAFALSRIMENHLPEDN